MDSLGMDTAFVGSVPHIYERYLVPLIFAPYATDLARRTERQHPSRVLELAAGTGVVTRELAKILPPEASIVATDLNQAMLDQASAEGTARPVEWRQADALHLPFPDESFDVVVCQFGVMFFPDKARAFAEARRVLRSGGQFLFNVWDRIEHNDFADTANRAVGMLFSDDPPRFLARVPHGYHDPSIVAQDLVQGGFSRSPQMTTLSARSQAGSPRIPAIAYCQGTPLRGEIEVRGPSRLVEATDLVTSAIALQFGAETVDGKIQAHIVAIES